MLLLFLLVAPVLSAQQAGWNVQRFGLVDGLPDNAVNYAVTDQYGYSWLSTESGLVRFDGQRFSRLPFMEQLDENPENIVRRMVIDRYGNLCLWGGGSEMVRQVDLRNYRSWIAGRAPGPDTAEKKAGQHLHFYLEANRIAGELRQGTDSLYVYQIGRDGNWRQAATVGGVPAQPNTSNHRYLGQQRDGAHLVYRHDQKCLLFIRGDKAVNSISLTMGDQPPRLMFLDREDRIWLQLGPVRQLAYVTEDSPEPAYPANLRQEDELRFNRAWEDTLGNLIFGVVNATFTSRLQLRHRDGGVEDLQAILRKENKLVSIAGDNFDRWFEMGTYGGYYRVIRQFNALELQNYLDDPDLPANRYGAVMRGFATGQDGRTYVNSEGAMWFSLQPPDYELDTLYPGDGTAEGPIDGIGAGHNLISQPPYIYGLYSIKGEATKGYLTRYHTLDKSWEQFDIPESGAIGRFVLALPEGDLLVFTFNRADRSGNVYRFNPATTDFTHSGVFNNWLPPRSRGSAQTALYDEARDVVWLATGNGLLRFTHCSPSASCYFEVQKPEIIQRAKFHIQSMELLADGKLLLGTYGDGIQLFDPDANEKTREVTRLPNDNVAEVLQLDDRHFAVATYNGLVVLDTASRQQLLYGAKDGFPSNEFNRLSAHLSEDGQLFLGGINGFSRLPVEKLLPKAIGPTPRISRYYRADEKSREETVVFPLPANAAATIDFPPNQLYFGFDFTTPGSTDVVYQSWLEGYEIGYTPASEDGTVEYLRVPPGEYTLHVKSINTTGETSAVPLSVPIRVLKPWYLRTWFLVLSQLLLIGLGLLFYENRVRRIRRQEAEKSRVARQLSEMEMKILRQQLNPHFIFNALGAIQHFIQSMRGADAMEYLADFAKLMRMFLESSKQSYIFLVDELELIKLYIRLEQLRFQGRFEVVYEIDPALDLEMEDIPSLLLQPFVENAINHGLFHLRRKGRLTIGMRRDEAGRIVCTVADDGIGRQHAAELRERTYKKHKSRATQIVAERLEIFQRDNMTDLEIRIDDLYPDREEKGTIVTIIVDNGE